MAEGDDQGSQDWHASHPIRFKVTAQEKTTSWELNNVLGFIFNANGDSFLDRGENTPQRRINQMLLMRS